MDAGSNLTNGTNQKSFTEGVVVVCPMDGRQLLHVGADSCAATSKLKQCQHMLEYRALTSRCRSKLLRRPWFLLVRTGHKHLRHKSSFLMAACCQTRSISATPDSTPRLHVQA